MGREQVGSLLHFHAESPSEPFPYCADPPWRVIPVKARSDQFRLGLWRFARSKDRETIGSEQTAPPTPSCCWLPGGKKTVLRVDDQEDRQWTLEATRHLNDRIPQGSF